MTTGEHTPPSMSASRQADSPIATCDLDHVPLFPLRYALTGDALVKATGGAACGAPPNSLSAVDNITFELTRVRGGYVLIYTESGLGVGSDPSNLWHVFYHCTTPEDDNAAAPRIDTEKPRSGIAHHFYKYRWDNGTAEGAWSIYTNEQLAAKGEEAPRTYPYPFVALGTSKAWIAYSEERWPAHFFKRAQEDIAFRNKMMTEVQISDEPSTSERFAPLTSLPNLSRSFSDSVSASEFEFSNSIRHTIITPSNWGAVATSPCARQYGYVVLVDDPIATALDLGALIILQQEAKTRLSQKYLYPLVTGKIIDTLQKNESIRTNTWSFLFGETRPHIDDFDAQFNNIQAESQQALDKLHEIERNVFSAWRSLVDHTAPGAIHERMTAYLEEFDAASEDNRAEIAGSALYELGRAAQPFGLCDNEQIGSYFDAVLEGQANAGAAAIAMVELIAKFGATFAATLSTAKEANFFYLLGWNAAVETFSARLNKRGTNFFISGQKLVTFRKSIPRTFKTQAEAAAAVHALFEEGRLNSSARGKLPSALTDLVKNETLAPRFPGGQPQTVYTIEGYRPLINQEIPPNWLSRADRLSTNGVLPLSGLGMVASALTLSNAVSQWNQARTYRQVQDWLFDPSVFVVVAFTQLAMSIYATRESARAVAQSSEAFARIYGRLPSLSGAAIAQTRIARGASSFMRGAGGKVLGPVVGVYLAAKDLNDGFENNDRNLKIAGILGVGSVGAFIVTGLVSGLPGWIALTIGALAAIGAAVYGYYRLNNYELWVRKGIWGNDQGVPEWWGRDRRAFNDRKTIAESIADPGSRNHVFASDAYEKEMQAFFDAASSLSIVNQAREDGKIEILCPELNTAHDLTRLQLRVFMSLQTEINGPVRSRDLTLSQDYTLRFDGSGRASIVLNRASFPAFKQVDTVTPRLIVHARFTRSNGATLSTNEGFSGRIESF